MAEGAENSEAASPKPSSGGSKIVVVLLVVILLLLAGVGGLLFTMMSRGGGGEKHEAARSSEAKPAEGKSGEGGEGEKSEKGGLPGPTQKLADFVVHLRDPESDRYARVSFEVEVGSEEDKARLNSYTPRIRDAFIAYLSDRTLEELRGSESIARTKAALAERLVQLAPGVKVRGLYVTDLVIQ